MVWNPISYTNHATMERLFVDMQGCDFGTENMIEWNSSLGKKSHDRLPEITWPDTLCSKWPAVTGLWSTESSVLFIIKQDSDAIWYNGFVIPLDV